jgi:vitamin B12 transporter
VLLLLVGGSFARSGVADEAPSSLGADIEQILVRGVRTGTVTRDDSVFRDSIDLRETIAEQLSLEDVLSELPGVQIRRFGGPGDPSEISIRGSTSAQVVIRLDGVRLNSAQSGTVDLSTLPVDLFERVDVRRGGGAIHVGSGAIGGVVDLVPRWPEAEPVTTLRLSSGSFGTWDGSAFHSGRVGETEFSLGYAGLKTDGDFEFQRLEFEQGGVTTGFSPPSAKRRNNRAEQQSGVATLRRQTASGDEIRLLHFGSFVSRGTPGLGSGTGVRAGQRLDAHARNTRSVSQLVFEGHEGRAVAGSARVSYSFERNHFRDPEPLFEAGEPIDNRTDNGAVAGRVELRWAGALEAIAASATVDGGFEGRHESFDANDRPSEERDVFGGWLRSEMESTALRARLIPSVRLDATQGFGTRWLPGVGVVFDPVPWLRLRGHVEKSFRAPSFDELFFPDQGFARGNPDLRPERALVADGGLELRLAQLGPAHDVSLQLGGFLHDIHESIVWFPVSPDTIEPRNTGEAREVGVEFAVAAAFGDWTRLGANVTWLDASFKETGASLPGRAPLEVSGNADFGEPDAWNLGLRVHYVSRLPVNEGGTLRLAARTTFDLAMAVELGWLLKHAEAFGLERRDVVSAQVWLGLRVRNLTDQSVRDALFFPQPGRTLHFTLEGLF